MRLSQRFLTLWHFIFFYILILTGACSGASISKAPVSTDKTSVEFPTMSQVTGGSPSETNLVTPRASTYPEPLDYPAPTQITDYSPYPYPGPASTPTSSIFATSGPPPSPVKDLGIVTGRLLVDNKPAANVILYLAEVTKDNLGVERIASFSRANSPKAYTDGDGQFYFIDVPPGKYGLILDIVASAFLLHIPGTEEQLLITVIAGEQVDLGDLQYDASLPTGL